MAERRDLSWNCLNCHVTNLLTRERCAWCERPRPEVWRAEPPSVAAEAGKGCSELPSSGQFFRLPRSASDRRQFRHSATVVRSAREDRRRRRDHPRIPCSRGPTWPVERRLALEALSWSVVAIEGLVNAALWVTLVVVIALVINGIRRSSWQPVDDRVQPAQHVAQSRSLGNHAASRTREASGGPLRNLFSSRKQPPTSTRTLSPPARGAPRGA